jgi:phage gpG-like protein
MAGVRAFPDIASFLAHMATRAAAMQEAQRHGEDEAGVALVTIVRDMIGTEIREWLALADSTVEEKQRLGYTGRVSATDPLYRTGELRLSISYRIENAGLIVGSTDPVAPFHEFGTSRTPARPFVGAAMFANGRHESDRIAAHVAAALAGDRAPSRKP